MGEVFAPSPLQQPVSFLSPPPPLHNLESPGLSLESKISPSIILIIIILAIIFFVSGLLHLLVRFLLRPNPRDPDEYLDNVTALQGQLQQLFHLHDAGVDQSYIDTLPVFQYKAIIGLKDPFDCAVCLCEFEPDDKLRLLPKCSHAFHMDCIDTWLLSHSTCPLCRASLLQDFGANNNNNNNHHGFSPIVCVLESGSNTVESSRELERDSRELIAGSNRHVGVLEDGEIGSSRVVFPRKSVENEQQQEGGNKKEEKIMTVKLGKFRNVDGGEGSSEINNNNNNNSNNSNNNSNSTNLNQNSGSSTSNELGSRRCYSMGSFAYVLDETTSLQVPIRTPMKKEKSGKKGNLMKAGNRGAMSEYGGDSRREFNGIEAFRSLEIGKGGNNHNNNNHNNNNNESGKKESFSISKIWSRGGDKSKRRSNGNEINQSSRRTISEFEIDVSELGGDNEETQSCYSVDSLANNPNNTTTTSSSSSTRRTLLWLMGRQNKIVHNDSSFSSNV